jgi:hypothetical protein
MSNDNTITAITNPETYYTMENGNLGTTLGTAETATVVVPGIAFVAPFSCSLKSVQWMLYASDASSATTFNLQFKLIKVNPTNGSATVNCQNIQTPSSDEFSSTSLSENRVYYLRNTYDNVQLGPGQGLLPLYTGSASLLKCSVYGRCEAHFERII